MTENKIKPIVPEDQTCTAVGYQSVSVCVPVTVTPFAKAGALPRNVVANLLLHHLGIFFKK